MTWIAGGLALLLLLFVRLYWMSLNEQRNIRNLLLMILLEEKVYARHRQGLADLVHNIDTDRADELSSRVMLSMDNLANNMNLSSLGISAGLLKVKRQPADAPFPLTRHHRQPETVLISGIDGAACDTCVDRLVAQLDKRVPTAVKRPWWRRWR